jgi:hypothetical protein
MTVELDSRHPLLPKTGWGKNENVTNPEKNMF